MSQHQGGCIILQVPESRRAILRRRCQPAIVGGERNPKHASRVATQLAQQFSCADVPEPDDSVATGGSQSIATGRKGNPIDISVAGRRLPWRHENRPPPSLFRIPEADAAVTRCGRDEATVRSKSNAIDGRGVSLQPTDHASRRSVPHNRYAIRGRRHQPPAVRGERRRPDRRTMPTQSVGLTIHALSACRPHTNNSLIVASGQSVARRSRSDDSHNRIVALQCRQRLVEPCREAVDLDRVAMNDIDRAGPLQETCCDRDVASIGRRRGPLHERVVQLGLFTHTMTLCDLLLVPRTFGIEGCRHSHQNHHHNYRDRQRMASQKANHPLGDCRRTGADRLASQPTGEIRLQVIGRGIAVRRVFLQTLFSNRGQLPGIDRAHFRADCQCPGNRRHDLRNMLPDDAGCRHNRQTPQIVGQVADEQFMQHKPERIDVGPPVNSGGVSIKLLRAHVPERADKLAHVRLQCRDSKVGIGGPSHTEIDHLGLTISADENVARFQITVHDPHPVAIGHRPCHVAQEHNPLPHREHSLTGKPVDRQRLLHQFHHKKRHGTITVSPGAGGVHLGHVWMPQPRQQACLLLEPSHHRVTGKAVPQHLHCHQPLRRLLTRLVHPPHSPLAQQANDHKPTEITAGCEVDGLLTCKAKRVSMTRERSGEATEVHARRVSCRSRSGGRIRSDKAVHRPRLTQSRPRVYLRYSDQSPQPTGIDRSCRRLDLPPYAERYVRNGKRRTQRQEWNG